MSLSAKTIHDQLARLNPLLESCSLETLRKGQEKVGEVMRASSRRRVTVKEHIFSGFQAAWVLPRDLRRDGVILYLHGGGYTCGGLRYALGFGSMLAQECGVNVFCPAYRLAPEHPFPAALEDAQEAYHYLLEKGYTPDKISLCGESAGGGLCYSLCMSLRDGGEPLPGSIIAISPWTDLTSSGASYEENMDKDVSMTKKRLRFFAESFTADAENPLASPLFGALDALPPSLIFAGGHEIMLSDARDLYEKLLSQGCDAQLRISPERWHAYLLYGLQEDREDMELLISFLNTHLSPERKLRWMRLDNAAKIYPASRSKSWSSLFRLSATLSEKVDPQILASALDVTVRRFPPIASRLRRGVFWYYLQQISHAPTLSAEQSYPLTRMGIQDIRRCAFRVIAYEDRIAVEFFHALTDGNGGLIFLKSLVAEYLQQRYGLRIPAEKGVLGRLEPPREEELEDSFQKYAGPVNASRKEADAWFPRGTPNQDGFLDLTCFTLDSKAVVEKAHSFGVSATTFLTAVMMAALQEVQKAQVPNRKRRKAIKVLVPVDLRRIFPSGSLRNFALYSTPEIDPRLGEYSLAEICHIVHHHIGLDLDPKRMSTKIAVNVNSERMLAVKLLPLPIKDLVMKAVFNAVGEKKACLCLSNLGRVELPEEMRPYVERLDFILGTQATKPHNCGVLSYGDRMYINFIRNIREPDLEACFFRVLRDLGLSVEVQSNKE